MRSTGKNGLLRHHQLLYTLGRPVKAVCELSNFIFSLHLHPGGEIAGTRRLDP